MLLKDSERENNVKKLEWIFETCQRAIKKKKRCKRKVTGKASHESEKVFPSTKMICSLIHSHSLLTNLGSKSATTSRCYQSHTTTKHFLTRSALHEAEDTRKWQAKRKRFPPGGKLGKTPENPCLSLTDRLSVAFSSRARAARTARQHLPTSSVSVSLSLSLTSI